MNIKKIAEEIIKGRRFERDENLEFINSCEIEELCEASNRIREHYCGNVAELCSIVNGRGGGCTEDCKFCAQSLHNNTDIKNYNFISVEELFNDCKRHEEKGINRYSIVTAGRNLDGEDLIQACAAYKKMKAETSIRLCASHGLLKKEAFAALRESGVERYHENIETSKRNFNNICTTHTYQDKINNIRMAKEMGFEICSGGIIGMGESFEDRIDMAISLFELKVESIPINILVPIKGTTLENTKPISQEEILRSIAMFRLINPEAEIRLGAGRLLLEKSGEKGFLSGANATITGDFLTTSGSNIDIDKDMMKRLGFKIGLINGNKTCA